MVDKNKSKKIGEALGTSGFTLGIVSLVIMLFVPFLGILFSVLGFIFCMVQQKKNQTKLGKAGLIINIIAFIVSIFWLFILIRYVTPFVESQLQGQSFPTA